MTSIIPDFLFQPFLELPVLLVIGWGGIGLLLLAGVRNPFFLASTAILGFVFIAAISFFVGLTLSLDIRATSLALSALVGTAALVKISARISYFKGLSLFVLLTLFAWASKWLFSVPERSGEDAISVMVQSILDIQQGQPPADLRRGFAYPLVISVSFDGSILSAATPLITVSVIVSIAAYGWRLLQGLKATGRLAVLSLVVLAFVSTPIFVLSLAYANSHMLQAQALLTAAGAMAMSLRQIAVSRENLVLMWIGLLVSGLVRFEGALLGSVALALFFLMGAEIAMSRVIVISLASSVVLGYLLYVMAFLSDENISMQILAGLAVMVSVASAGLLRKFFARVPLAMTLRVLSLLVLLLPVLLTSLTYPGSGLAFVRVAAQNLLVGVGGWGLFLSATLVVFLISISRPSDRVVVFLTRLSLWGALATVTLKLLDSPPGNLGFNNTIVRTLLHWIGPISLMWIVVFAAMINRAAGSVVTARLLPMTMNPKTKGIS